ncbi:Tn3 family transposase [Streptomyces sp. NPDC019937]|uniref:Tn3 family transposase n=1 Tax=Streptomyces sp. NPDC019937 TaxID=3154787 RepID=UPI0033D3813A
MITAFVKGANLGPYEAARHIPGVSGHELSLAANRHFSIPTLNEAIADLVNAHARLDISQAWGDGSTAAADGTHVDTYLNNLLSETSVRYGKPGGIAYHHISDTYIALFTHFIPCGVWEAVYIIEGLLKNTSHRPRKRAEYVYIDALFGESGRNVIDSDLIESQFRHLMRVAISVREGVISSTLLLRRLRAGSRKNGTYTAFREVGRVIRTVQLLRYLSDAPLRRRVTAATNKVEASNGFSQWIGFGNGGVITDNDPVEQEKTAKFNALLTNAVIFHNALDIAEIVRQLQEEGWEIDPEEPGPHLAVPDRAHPPLRRILHPRTRHPARGVLPAPGHRLQPAARRRPRHGRIRPSGLTPPLPGAHSSPLKRRTASQLVL